MRSLIVALALIGGACSPPPAGKPPAEVPQAPPRLDPPPRVVSVSCPPKPKTPAFGDPVAEADKAAAAGDFRVFKVTGFLVHQVPQIHCPSANAHRLQSRGGIFVSDTPDLCGDYSRADVSRQVMSSFNRRLAQSPGFRAATGCRLSTYCEEAYDKDGTHIPPEMAKFDPRCPRSRNLLLAIIQSGSPADLRKAIAAGALRNLDRSDPNRDPARAAVIRNRLDNLKVLVAAGEKAGRDDLVSDAAAASSSQQDVRPLIGYLISKGADPTGGCTPGLQGHSALQMAVVTPSPALFDWLMAKGADPAKSFACNSVTAVAQALNGAMMYGPDAASQSRAAIQRRMAIRMIERGGVAQGGQAIEMLRRQDRRTLSVLIAAWRREGTEAAMLATMRDNARDSKLSAMLAWVDEVETCKHRIVEFVDDRARLCAGWP